MKVSIIIPTMEERKEMLKEALVSICDQTVQPSEIIVFNGDKDVKKKLNESIAKSIGDAFLVFCDDDELEPTYIEQTTNVMEERGADIVGTWIRNFGDDTKIHGFTKFPPGTSLTRKSIWKKVGGYDIRIKLGGDYDFFTMCKQSGAKIEIIPQPLLNYRRHPHNWSSKESWEESNKIIHQKYKKQRDKAIEDYGFKLGYHCQQCGKRIPDWTSGIDLRRQCFCSPKCYEQFTQKDK